jgi:ribonuclease HII
VADTKHKRDVAYWDDLFRQIDRFKSRGLDFVVEKIPPWHVDRYNLNKIMDVVYQRIISFFLRHAESSQCRVVIDDYGVGATLGRYLRALENAGTEVVVATGADDRFLEARVASVLAKREREKVIEALRQSPQLQVDDHTVGSGNAGDPETLAWLKAWKATGKQWPWFVKRSFRTVRAMDRLSGEAKKEAPPIRDDILSQEFLEAFEQGRLSITSLSIVCPVCGAVSKAALVTPDKDGKFVGRCISCKKLIANLGFTLRYYCGYVLPDSNIITGGLLSKDLGRSRFFEGFTVLLDATVRSECDTPGGKQELGRLARFAAMGRIGLEAGGSPQEGTNFQRDEAILDSAIKYNSVLITNDQNVKAAAQARQLFVLSTS